MPRKTIPAYCRHSTSGQAYVKIDGRRKYLGVYGTPESHQRYAAEISRWQESADAPPSTLTIGQLALLYVERCKTHYRKDGVPTTEFSAVQRVLKRVNRMYRAVLAVDFSGAMLIAVRQTLIDEGLARTTVNREVGRIRRMFRWALGDGKRLIPASVLTELEAVTDLKYGRSAARETEPVKPVPDAWVEAVKTHVSRQIWGVIEFQRATGARPTEALIVRPCDIDMTSDVWEYRPHRHKTQHHGKERVVMIGPKGQAVLREFMAGPDDYAFRPQDAINDLVAKRYRAGAKPRKVGRRYTIHGYAAAIRRACVKAKVPHWSANQIRHSFGTSARKIGGVEGARVVLGHSSAVTSEIYAEADQKAARPVVAMIG
ncbi:site-specific tyrosine recombinase XerD [Caulifigura coniformis]|uniref:Site-specific tyrosine recombinase XerD n=1 Tax=Caulifigura coniformis TaxID=2527983 RepID=A0A517SF92_9PLAN|nr:tyrosine-type recombinase/integrase [Caulifigura coniformis]QDT54767.1 site-specific tyrosine recombinase XerD [Caulifigura coniformis]